MEVTITHKSDSAMLILYFDKFSFNHFFFYHEQYKRKYEINNENLCSVCKIWWHKENFIVFVSILLSLLKFRKFKFLQKILSLKIF